MEWRCFLEGRAWGSTKQMRRKRALLHLLDRKVTAACEAYERSLYEHYKQGTSSRGGLSELVEEPADREAADRGRDQGFHA